MTMERASPSRKALPLVCLVVLFAISLTLFLIRNHRYVDHLPAQVQNSRTVFQILVQVLSYIFSVAQMVVVCALINFAARIRLFKSPTSTADLSFWAALSTPRLDTSLPLVKLLLAASMLLLGTGLGAIWAGALTPLFSTSTRTDGMIHVPLYNKELISPMPLRNGDGVILEQCGNKKTADPRGPAYPPLSNCIVESRLGSLMMTASTATNVTSPYQHPKLYNSTWTYRGRSYGQGSGAGFYNVTNTTTSTPDRGFSYLETGYYTNATCTQQNYTIFPFTEYDTGSNGQFGLWSADTVTLLSGNITIPKFAIAAPNYNNFNSHPFGYFAWTAFTANNTSYIATSAQNPSWSQSASNILCTLTFQPYLFRTNISTTDQLITVTPLQPNNTFNQTGSLQGDVIEQVILDLDLISRLSGSSLGFAPLYLALGTNLNSISLAYNATGTTAWELSIRDALLSLVDDLLTGQGVLAVARDDGESTPVSVERHFQAIKIGETRWLITQLVINIVLCLIWIFEAIRTRYWRDLPKFDFIDTKALAIAALGPEKSPTNPVTVTTRHKESETSLLTYYDGAGRPRLRYASAVAADEHRGMRPPSQQSVFTMNDFGSVRSQRSTYREDGGADLSQTHLLGGGRNG